MNPNDHLQLNGRSFDFSLVDFWTWYQPDLIENRTQGILAALLVRQDLKIDHPTRLEWDNYDLITRFQAITSKWKLSQLPIFNHGNKRISLPFI